MLDQPYASLIQKLIEEISKLTADSSGILNMLQKSIGICSMTLMQLKAISQERGFKNTQEEINFFKIIKPKVYSKLIFYHTLFKIESKKPKSRLFHEKYYKRVLKKLHKFFRLKEAICRYYWSEQKYNDELYFLRKNRNITNPADTLFPYIDHEFSTLHDYTFSCIMAHEQLIKYIENEIEKLNNIGSHSDFLKYNYTWTDSKIALVELIYAVHSAGSINNGKIDIKELVELFEKLFNIDLEEYSRTFIDIRMRKTGRTKFLDYLKHSLLKRMEDVDG